MIQAKLAFERLPVPKVFHPFVCGPYNHIIKTLMEETGAKINVPPTSVHKDEIVVSGEKEGVIKCKTIIMRTYEERVCIQINLSLSSWIVDLYKFLFQPKIHCVRKLD